MFHKSTAVDPPCENITNGFFGVRLLDTGRSFDEGLTKDKKLYLA